MVTDRSLNAIWKKRIARAEELAERNPSAKEILNFYRHILRFQQEVYVKAAAHIPKQSPQQSKLRENIPIDNVASDIPALLALVQREGPPRLAQTASQLRSASPQRLCEILCNGLEVPNPNTEEGSFFARALLQPYAEYVARGCERDSSQVAGNKCPCCEGEPQLAVIRPEGDGGKRSLLCCFCQTEWEFRRILCPSCGEENHEKLPRYTAESIAAVRVEACDTCHRYLKSIDLTIDGLAVPVVDEIAATPLDLWAADYGYTKVQVNLLGF